MLFHQSREAAYCWDEQSLGGGLFNGTSCDSRIAGRFVFVVFIKHVDALEAREDNTLIGTVRQPSSEGRRAKKYLEERIQRFHLFRVSE